MYFYRVKFLTRLMEYILIYQHAHRLLCYGTVYGNRKTYQ